MKKRSRRGVEFSADKPISSAKQDKLGRAAFAKSLADKIRGWSAEESLVVGLQGEWGCGKSSVKNLIIENLTTGRSKRIDIIEFHPWEMSQHRSISAAFVRELEAVLGRAKPKNLDPLIKKLRAYGSVAGLLTDESKLRIAFERLDAHRHSLGRTISSNIVTSLTNASDLLPNRVRFSVETDPISVAWRLVYFSFRQVESLEDRFEKLKAGLQAAVGVRLAVDIAQLEQRHEQRNAHEFLVTESQAQDLIVIALENIRKASRDGRLRKLKDFDGILFWWRKWAGEEEPKQWISSALKSPSDALWLLSELLSRSSETSSRTIIRHYIRLDGLDPIVDITILETLTKGVRITDLEECEARALKAFRYALRWRKEGRKAEYTGGKMGDGPLDSIN